MKIDSYDEIRAVDNLYNRLSEYTLGDYKNLPEDIRKMYNDLLDYCQESVNEFMNSEKTIFDSHAE